jgi:hypothetical protein
MYWKGEKIMKINLTDNVKKDGLISHIVLNSISETTMNALVKTGSVKGIGVFCNLILTANGHELDLEAFVDHWQNQVDRIIEEKAEELLADRFREIQDMLTTLEERIKSEINKRLED